MEYIDIVDENDNVIGVNTRHDSYKNKTTNRVVSVLIFNSENKLLLQQRSSSCSFMPGAWGLSAGGHVEAGETYEEAAKKELKEELGIETDLKFKTKFYNDRLKINGKLNKDNFSHYFFDAIFEGTYDGEINFLRDDNDEVQDVGFFSFEEIKEMIKKDRNNFMQSSIYILENYYLYE